MYHRALDLIAVSALAAIALGLSLVGVSSAALRLPFALLLVFVLPGYALTAATLGRAPMNLERFLLTLGMSLVMAVLSGLVLNWTPGGLRAETWAALLAFITIEASLVAFARRSVGPTAPARPLARLSVVNGLLLGLAIAVMVGAIVLARSAAARYPGMQVVQLWILPGDSLHPDTVRVGVSNQATAPATFRVQIQQSNHILSELQGVTIAARGTWETVVTLGGVQPGAGPVEAFLYRADAQDIPYRHVLFWLNTQGQSQ